MWVEGKQGAVPPVNTPEQHWHNPMFGGGGQPGQAPLGAHPSNAGDEAKWWPAERAVCATSSPPAFLLTSQQRFWHPQDGRAGAVPGAGENGWWVQAHAVQARLRKEGSSS